MPQTPYLTNTNLVTDVPNKINTIIDLLETYNNASKLSFVPSGNLSSTTVQLAINELQSDVYAVTDSLTTSIASLSTALSTNVATINASITSNFNTRLLKTNNLSDLSNVVAARSNLGLGTSALLNVGTGANNVVQLNSLAQIPAIDGRNILNVIVPRNRFYAHSARIAQRYGLAMNNLTVTSGVGSAYFADNFQVAQTGGGLLKGGLAAIRSPAGSPNRYQVGVATATSTFATNDYYGFAFYVIGADWADAFMGTSTVGYFTCKFVVNAPAGTYGVTFKNSGGTRVYCTTFTISSGQALTDVPIRIQVPIDNSGTWVIDNSSLGIGMQITLACGAGRITSTLNSWQTASGPIAPVSMLGNSSQINFVASTANLFQICDVAIYPGAVDPDYQLPSIQSEIASAQRQLQIITMSCQSAGVGYSLNMWFTKVTMRTTPTATFRDTLGSSSAATVNGVAVYDNNSGYFQILTTASGGFVIGSRYHMICEF